MNPVLVLLSLGAASVGLSIRAVEPMLPVLASEFSVTVPVAAQVITVFALLYAAGQFVHGPLGDRYGKLPVIAVMLLGASGTFLGCALAPGLTSLTVWRAAAGVFSAAPFILGMAYIGDTVPLERRQTTIAQFVTGNVIGHACGPLLAGIITDAFGWRAMFVFLTGLFALVGVLMVFTARARRGTERRSALTGNAMSRYLEVVKLPKVQVLAWVAAFEAFFFFGAYAYVGALLKERFDVSYTIIGLALAGLGVGGLAFNTSIRWLLRRLSQPRMVLSGGLACGALYVVLALLPVWPPVFLIMAGLGFTFYMLHNVLQTRATEASPQARGIGMSVFGVSWTLGQSLGVALMGGGIAVFGFAPMIAAFGVGFAALGAWMRLNLQRLP
jgi:predicted MFS family arabinose efflux permease